VDSYDTLIKNEKWPYSTNPRHRWATKPREGTTYNKNKWRMLLWYTEQTITKGSEWATHWQHRKGYFSDIQMVCWN